MTAVVGCIRGGEEYRAVLDVFGDWYVLNHLQLSKMKELLENLRKSVTLHASSSRERTYTLSTGH